MVYLYLSNRYKNDKTPQSISDCNLNCGLIAMVTNTIDGFLLINKPQGLTSFDCVTRIKKTINCKIKIGHAGTLDPFATGLLIIAIGRQATRCMSSVMKLDKNYIATGKCGELTDTLDNTGTITETDLSCAITKNRLIEAIALLGNSYTQTPPIYSALKYQGKPLYALARKNKITQKDLEEITKQKSRCVQLYELALTNYSHPFFTIQTHVSHGTYIRSLVNDIAGKADSYATTHVLQRTKIGSFSVEDARELDQLQTRDEIADHIITVDDFMHEVTGI